MVGFQASAWVLQPKDYRLSTPFVAWGGACCSSPSQGALAAEGSAGDGDGLPLCAWRDRQAASKSQDLVVGAGGRAFTDGFNRVSAHRWRD